MTKQAVLEGQAAGDLRVTMLTGTAIADRRIHAAGISTAVLEQGTGDDIVLLHGPGEFAGGWIDTIIGLAARHHVVAPDLPGHGSTAAPVDLDAGAALDWLGAVIAMSCTVPAVLVGRGGGGAIAARLCLDRPELVRQLVLVDTLGLAPFDPAPPFGEAMRRFLTEPTDRTLEQLMEYCTYDFATVRRRLGDRWTAVARYSVDRARLPGTVQAVTALMAELGDELSEASLAGLRVPTALIWGRHDMATPLSVAESASRAFGWPLIVIENAADDPALEQPDAFLDAVHQVLQRRRQS